jgi:hypothetical protein
VTIIDDFRLPDTGDVSGCHSSGLWKRCTLRHCWQPASSSAGCLERRCAAHLWSSPFRPVSDALMSLRWLRVSKRISFTGHFTDLRRGISAMRYFRLLRCLIDAGSAPPLRTSFQFRITASLSVTDHFLSQFQ